MAEAFGKYELLEKIGEGGMAEVWKARSTGAAGFQKILVVKKILPMFAKNKAFIDMLVAEAKVCSSLHHPNIVPIFDLGEIDGAYYITMEFVDGVDLLRVLQRAARQRAKVPVEVALFIAGEVARGLAYAHGAVDHEGRPLNVIHRDVSPANVMVSTRGEVKLMDFGVARADLEIEQRRGAATLVRHDGLKGKLSYMSPELVTGQEYDHRSDIFALGTLLFEMLTLKRLFMGKSELQTMANVRKARITRRIERHDYLPEPVTDIIRRALARDAEDRYPSAQDFYDDVQDYLYEARLRVDPSVVARFIITLFPERAPRVAKPRVAASTRQGRNPDTIEDRGLPASLDEELRTVRTGRPQVFEDTIEEQGQSVSDGAPADEDAAGAEERAARRGGRKKQPTRGARIIGPPVGRRELEAAEVVARIVDEDPVDELLLALEGELGAPTRVVDLDDDEADFEGAEVPGETGLRLKGGDSDADFFGPVTLNNLKSLVANRAVGGHEQISVAGGAWVRLAHTDLKRLSPELFERPGALVHAGPLDKAWLPRLFHQLSAAGATGTLELARGWVRKELHYVDGALMHIQSNIKTELLAHVALDSGAVTEAQITAALNTGKSLGLPVGEGLVAVGALDETRLPALLREQQRRRFVEIFGWTEGRFAFYDDTVAPELATPEPLDVLALLGPAVRAHYDLATLRTVFHAQRGRAVTRRARASVDPAAVGLSRGEAAALEALPERITVEAAIASCADDAAEADLLRALFLMLQLELMQFAPA